MGSNEEQLAFDLVTSTPFMIESKRVYKARKWAPDEVPTIDAETLIEVANASRNRQTLELEENVPLVVECLGEPRTIDTGRGPWDVLDVSLPDGTEHLISLGRTVLKKAIAAHQPTTSKKLVLMNQGKPRGKQYFAYVVMTLEAYQKQLQTPKKSRK